LDQVTVSGGGNRYWGGAVENLGKLTVSNSTLTNNSATGAGGAIQYGNGTVSVINSTNSGNSAPSGGGIMVNSSNDKVTITNSTIYDNTATNYGGGIMIQDGWVEMKNSTLTGNSASSGGAIFIYAASGSSTLTVTSSTISANSATSVGGLYHYSSSSVTVTNLTTLDSYHQTLILRRVIERIEKNSCFFVADTMSSIQLTNFSLNNDAKQDFRAIAAILVQKMPRTNTAGYFDG
jgi:hypothetical protein